MDSNFRGSYPPSSLIVPGPSGFPGPPPPQFLIPDPTAMFAEVLGAIHKEGLNQRQHVNDRFSSVVRGYTDMGTTYNECLRQTDRILAEQGARFEARLENVQKAIRQLNDSQTTAIATLNERLDSFEGLIESSRKSIDSEITTAVQTMGRRFFELSAGITNSHCNGQDPLENGMPAYDPSLGDITSKNSGGPSLAGNTGYESQFDHFNGSKGVLFPAAWSQTDSEAEPAITYPPPLPDGSSLEPGGSREEQSTVLPPVAVLNEPDSPTTSSCSNLEFDERDQLSSYSTPVDINDAAVISADVPPFQESPCDADTPTPQGPPCDPSTPTPQGPPYDPSTPPPQEPSCDSDVPPPQGYPLDAVLDPPQVQEPSMRDLFDCCPSPLTQLSTSCSQDSEEPQTPHAPHEEATYMSSPLASNVVSRKRKRASNRPKKPRRSKRSRCETKQDPIEELHADPSIWPPVIDVETNQNYISCDRCAGWYHYGCVALEGAHEDDTPWECPPCTKDPTRCVVKGSEGERCSRPGCHLSTSEEYFMDRLLGRRYDPKLGLLKYLVSYEGYHLRDSTWEPAENFANDFSKIDEFMDWWATENPTVDVESLDPHETIFIRDAFNCARNGMTWIGI